MSTKTKVYSAEEVRQLLAAEVEKAGGVREYARHIGINHSWVSNTLRGHVNPSGTIMSALGFQRVKGYERIPE